MRKLTESERNQRDAVAAEVSIQRARDLGETVGIAVDDRTKVPAMLKRVTDRAVLLGYPCTVEEQGGGAAYINFTDDDDKALGTVRIIPGSSPCWPSSN